MSFTFSVKRTTVSTIKRRKTTTPNHEGGDKGLNEREVILYSICAVVFALVILVCISCQHRYKQIYDNFRSYQTVNRRRRNKPEISLPNIPHGDIEGIYEVIDESNMIDVNIENVRYNSQPVTYNDDSNSDSTEKNDYLTPYQPADDDSITNKSDSSEISNCNNEITSDCRSIASSYGVPESRSSYLTMYQPIVACIDIQENTFSQFLNKPGSFEQEVHTSESGCLNPYEPMIAARDLHDYLSVPGSLSDTST
ncbi:Hypothetical predicted protein [Mytilus galloprovincialis]|uniref:Uncharacterized protein n=1 Tax=Mytilus galloprovincialis TaxID=29158 RepID=A0A8B6HFS1_MYTGA|nr:Hypothetical predicted protein [Mytilus galloprovincialis]